ncbi:5'-nucleotidase, cytosolic IB a [Scleropages formosus]|uniref:5'-nucleotidase, cytosolic IB n=1 Tax=Scleropages formosus TaxID=113540 RepID=A0A8C9QZN2_SCLFO|nr:cytosolic 5'-nucleotidase 1A-like [Scleropages formosus]
MSARESRRGIGQKVAAEPPAPDSSNAKKPRLPKPQNAVTVAVSSHVLFDMAHESKVYDEQGLESYVKYQVERENEPLKPRVAFSFIKALMNVNARLRELYPDSEELFDIILMTNNHAQVGFRLINSINHHDLPIERFCMTGSSSPVRYLKACMTNLYLSTDPEKVQEAIKEGIAAATMFPVNSANELSDTQLRVAFDGDGVLFSDESEKVFKKEGLNGFIEHEKQFADKPLGQGPLKCFLEDLAKLQKKFYSKNKQGSCPIRTYLVTSRDAPTTGIRALNTLRSWGLEIDELFFLAGAPKGPLLQKIGPHIFFDDQMCHIKGAQELGTTAAHVPNATN